MTFHPDIKLQVEKQLDLAFWAIRRWREEPTDSHYLSVAESAFQELGRLGFHTLMLKKDASLVVVRQDVWDAMKKYKEVANGLGVGTSEGAGSNRELLNQSNNPGSCVQPSSLREGAR